MNDLIILGGGSSVIEGIDNNLFEKIQNKYVIGLNYSYRYIKTTINMFIDWKFYESEQQGLNKLPLVIGQKLREIKNPSKNIHLLTANNKYQRNLEKGVYKSTLCGLFSLSFAIWLLDVGTIYLLGFDYGSGKDKSSFGVPYDKNKIITHWTQCREFKNIYTGKNEIIPHRGFGKVNWYEAKHTLENGKQITRAEHEFNVYANETKVKIYNVSLESKIPTFPKISYDEFFKKLNKKDFNQAILRYNTLEKLKTLESK